MPRRPHNPRAQRRLGLPLAALVLMATAALALSAPDDDRPDAGSLSVMAASGTLEHDNSLDGAAILSASKVWPGWTGSGDVTITNTGTAGSWLRLTEAAVSDVPGPGGGQLSNRLSLVIEDVTIPAFPVPAYTGLLGAVGERWLGRLEPGEVRTYRFRTAMPHGVGDNAYQSSAVNVRFEWAVSDTDPTGTPVDPPADPPADPAADPPVEEPPVDEPPVDAPAEEPPVIVPEDPPVVVVSHGKLNVKLAVPAAQRPLQRRSLKVLASCSRRCTATVKGRLGITSRASSGLRMKGRTRSLAAGVKTRVRLRISPRAMRRTQRALQRGRTVRGYIRIVARDRSGRVARVTQRIRLVPVRK